MSTTAAGPNAAGPGRAPVGAVFAALADDHRRRILRALGTRPSLTQSEVAAILPITRQAVAKHLSALRSAQLVRRRPLGRTVRYELDPDGMATAMAWMATVGRGWDERLARLRLQLEPARPSVP
ncbi:MAG TPA: metalloregulator ArsR/SmtB family transcription factor [Candidatus Micrarchaeia archaeon]|nr:metalloregulator ArsR/SmtB family transcription factor [Candidatus Micrarchaeia archaeon]